MAAAALLALGCARFPTSLEPGKGGSVGLPHRGVLSGGHELAASGPGYRFLRDNGRRSALPRFAEAIARAAKRVSEERPGATLTIGDLSPRTGGGPLLPHLSHRSGRDADLLLYLTTTEGAPVVSPGFVKVGADGLAQDPQTKRFYRFDVEREWLLVRELLTDPQARTQWIFVHQNVRATLLEWAAARGESPDLLWRAAQVMAQPQPGGLHDDHIHVRTACDASETAAGCEAFGPARPWLLVAGQVDRPSDLALARELLGLPSEEAVASTTAGTSVSVSAAVPASAPPPATAPLDAP